MTEFGMDRFRRLAQNAGGTKLCGRAAVNRALSHADAMDEARFLRGLRARLGEPDASGDAVYSFSVQDRVTGISFEAYSGASGPSYGGEIEYLAKLPTGGRALREDVRQVLSDFDAWVDEASE